MAFFVSHLVSRLLNTGRSSGLRIGLDRLLKLSTLLQEAMHKMNGTSRLKNSLDFGKRRGIKSAHKTGLVSTDDVPKLLRSFFILDQFLPSWRKCSLDYGNDSAMYETSISESFPNGFCGVLVAMHLGWSGTLQLNRQSKNISAAVGTTSWIFSLLHALVAFAKSCN